MKKLSSEMLRSHKGVSFVGVSTCFICHDGKGNFFMSKRSNNARDERGKWEIGGGGLKWGFKAEDNMIREVEEEYGAKPKDIRFLGYRDIFRKLEDSTPTHWLGLDFAVLVDRKDVRIVDTEMIDEGDWFTLKNLPSPLHSQMNVFTKKYKIQLEEILG